MPQGPILMTTPVKLKPKTQFWGGRLGTVGTGPPNWFWALALALALTVLTKNITSESMTNDTYFDDAQLLPTVSKRTLAHDTVQFARWIQIHPTNPYVVTNEYLTAVHHTFHT